MVRIKKFSEFGVCERLGIQPIGKDRLESLKDDIPYMTFKKNLEELLMDLEDDIEGGNSRGERRKMKDLDLRFPWNNEIYNLPKSESDIRNLWNDIVSGFKKCKFENNDDGNPEMYLDAWYNRSDGSSDIMNRAIGVTQRKDGGFDIIYQHW